MSSLTTTNKLNRLELQVLTTALANYDVPEVREFFYKIPLLRVAERKYTGIGFFTMFEKDHELRSTSAAANPPRERPPGAVGFHPDLNGYVDFMVWINDGMVECIEAASSGPWPANSDELVISACPD